MIKSLRISVSHIFFIEDQCWSQIQFNRNDWLRKEQGFLFAFLMFWHFLQMIDLLILRVPMTQECQIQKFHACLANGWSKCGSPTNLFELRLTGKCRYKAEVKLTGFLYPYRITDNASSPQFAYVWATGLRGNVGWSRLLGKSQREAQLKEKCLRPMSSQGASISRPDNTSKRPRSQIIPRHWPAWKATRPVSKVKSKNLRASSET